MTNYAIAMKQPVSDQLPEFLTVNETAERYKVSPRTIKRWIDSGELKARRIGRSIRIPVSSLEDAGEPAAWIDRQAVRR